MNDQYQTQKNNNSLVLTWASEFPCTVASRRASRRPRCTVSRCCRCHRNRCGSSCCSPISTAFAVTVTNSGNRSNVPWIRNRCCRSIRPPRLMRASAFATSPFLRCAASCSVCSLGSDLFYGPSVCF